ncbi:uncharacterized protein [Littorina saxatilis]|uniref:Uncharacterized protein n=1 Tax=Littorina saxatilis TaxID=31220 RepID=A0AAN9BGV3_9CAEN
MGNKLCWITALAALSMFCHCKLDPPTKNTVTRDVDHTIITRAVFNDSDHAVYRSKSDNKQNADVSGYPALNTTNLMQVYDVCFPQATDEFQCDAFPGNIIVDYDCVQGPVHDPCYSLETNLQTITLRRHWKTPPDSPNWTDSERECKCRISSPVSQKFEMTAVNLYAESNDSDSLIKVISLSSNPSIYIPLGLTPYPRNKTIQSKRVTVKFHNNLKTAVQIVTINASNSNLNIYCEGHDDLTTTIKPFSHDVTSVDALDAETATDGNFTLQPVIASFSFPLRDVVVGSVLTTVLLIILIVVVRACRRKHRKRQQMAFWSRFSIIRNPAVTNRPSLNLYSADELILRDDLDAVPEDCISFRSVSSRITTNTYRPASAAPVPPTPPADPPLHPPQFLSMLQHPTPSTPQTSQAEAEASTSTLSQPLAAPRKITPIGAARSRESPSSPTEAASSNNDSSLSACNPVASASSMTKCSSRKAPIGASTSCESPSSPTEALSSIKDSPFSACNPVPSSSSMTQIVGRKARNPATNPYTHAPRLGTQCMLATMPRLSSSMNDELNHSSPSAVVSRPRGIPPKPKRRLLRQMSDDVVARCLQGRHQDGGGEGGSENSSSWLYEDANTVIPE